MKNTDSAITVGIIAEFNPFHKGHEYLIKQAKRLTEAEYCVVVMSGDFVQSGAPAICDKYLRTKMALMGGADAVFELPTAYATATAEIFAEAGIKLLYTLGCVDYVVFGSECGDIVSLEKLAGLFVSEPPKYSSVLQQKLKEGLSFPAAREAAVLEYTQDENLSKLLESSNNILAVEYCKALLRLKNSVAGNSLHRLLAPLTVKRLGSDYRSEEHSGGTFSSATAIRAELEKLRFSDSRASISVNVFPPEAEALPNTLRESVPTYACDILAENLSVTPPVTRDDFSNMLFIRLSTMSSEELNSIAELSPDLLNAVQKSVGEVTAFTALIEKLKSKNNLYNSIGRALLHVMLGIDKSHAEYLKNAEVLPYARLLGFRRSSSALLRTISDTPDCNLITKLADADRSQPLLKADLLAAGVYSQVATLLSRECPASDNPVKKTNKNTPSEFERGVIII